MRVERQNERVRVDEIALPAHFHAVGMDNAIDVVDELFLFALLQITASYNTLGLVEPLVRLDNARDASK